MSNGLINWLEIPVVDMKRAIHFYEQVFETTLRRETMSQVDMAVFPNPDPGGALVAGEDYRPSQHYGTLPYLHAPGLDALLQRVAHAGGKTVFGPLQLPGDIGRIAHIADSEGNRIGLHEPFTG
ncbi:VOC family protein [Cupriavidus sp. WKF15]|uniref:VOC family protein n=1 Tax=Cupriavidus sp. WKF15 TaxID=3032282 RepID=UPI0023E136BA|nr:VOC family protein [Cupriavidus sp. WKF15]WER45376.1 VOC family protein [Cupriavidus sp. WKF15]